MLPQKSEHESSANTPSYRSPMSTQPFIRRSPLKYQSVRLPPVSRQSAPSLRREVYTPGTQRRVSLEREVLHLGQVAAARLVKIKQQEGAKERAWADSDAAQEELNQLRSEFQKREAELREQLAQRDAEIEHLKEANEVWLRLLQLSRRAAG